MAKVFAIGDIHGCHKKLVALLKQLPVDPQEDILVFMGDYINRGPDSRRVLDTLIALQRTHQTVFLKGNHEQSLMDYELYGEPDELRMLRVMGVEATAESYGATLRRLTDFSCMPTEHQQFLFDLQLTWRWESFFFTHADFDNLDVLLPVNDPNETMLERRQRHTAEARILASRRLNQENDLEPPPEATIIFGHLPYATPLLRPDRIGIDTGAVYGNLLTAVQLPEQVFYHA